MPPPAWLESFFKSGFKFSIGYVAFLLALFFTVSATGTQFDPETNHVRRIEFSVNKKVGGQSHYAFYITPTMDRVLSLATLPLYPIAAFLLLWLVSMLFIEW